MRGTRIFSGSSHPTLVSSICERLGDLPSEVQLKTFENGETQVSIGCSIRDKDVFVVQSGSSKTNSSIMELLIMINACKGGSAQKITAVMPYFPYSRQSKKKSHRGAITAKMIANLLTIAGVDHIITVDLHASQMQGFFSKPVDNLKAEPLIAHWIRQKVPHWKNAVVVSKNPGGTKRVTSLADALRLSFGIVTLDKRRGNMSASTFLDGAVDGLPEGRRTETKSDADLSQLQNLDEAHDVKASVGPTQRPRLSTSGPTSSTGQRSLSNASEEYNDERARDVITGRLVDGKLVDDDYPTPMVSASASSSRLSHFLDDPSPDPLSNSVISTSSRFSGTGTQILDGAYDVAASSDEETEIQWPPELEQIVTLVGNVRDKTVFVVDDMIDKPRSWIAAAETVVKRGGAKKVYCIATHGLFGNDCLAQMEQCKCIDYVVVTNSFPISPEKASTSTKLVVLDISHLLSEAIRRNHYGESISQLFQYHYE
ncbi:MAG: hypothetical protein M1825_000770 [Sarcosagium campestre]|nr:MAG: hypothetical protein M1825_000770 [Sarcosagium campestre]